MRDVYSIMILKPKLIVDPKQSITFTIVEHLTFGYTPIKFRLSPFNSNEITVLTEESRFHTVDLTSY